MLSFSSIMDEIFNQCLINNPFKFEPIPSIMFLAEMLQLHESSFYTLNFGMKPALGT